MCRSLATMVLWLLVVPGCGGDDGGIVADGSPMSRESGGGGEVGFGDYCSDVAKPCKPGFLCAREFGSPFGVCTKKCSTLGETCPGAATGTRADCLANILGSSYGCVFVCGSVGATTYACPPDLQCRQDQQLPGGLFRCLP